MSFVPKNRVFGSDSRNHHDCRPSGQATPGVLLAEARRAVLDWLKADAVLARITRLAVIPLACSDHPEEPTEALDRAFDAMYRAARLVRVACGLPPESKKVATIMLADGRAVTALPFGRELDGDDMLPTCLVVSDRTAGMGDRPAAGN